VKSRGISISEVLVATGLCALTASLVMAGAMSFRRSAQRAVCASHLKTLWQALSLYRVSYGGADNDCGDVGRMGLPPSWMQSRPFKPLFGRKEDWRCPAPKRLPEPYLPHYDYMAYGPDERVPVSFEQNSTRYKGRLPILLDYNHNNPRLIKEFLPRLRKEISFIDISGNYKTKTVTRAYNSIWDIEFFELDNSQ
jgi:hypothetical protein